MQWLHTIFDQAKYCILDMAVLVLFCIGIARIVRSEAERLRDTPKKSQERGPNAAPLAKASAPRNGGNTKKASGPKLGATPRPQEPTRKA